MNWFRRRRRRNRPDSAPFDASTLPPREPVTFEAAVSEGVMVAEYAARLRLRNSILIGAVGGADDYEPRRYMTEARATVSSLAAESDAAAKRLEDQIAEAESLSGKGGHAHDYRAGDVRNLRRRASVSRELAKRLRDFREDDEYLLELIERSRDEAWRDISRTLVENARRIDFRDDRYEEERESRQADLIADLERMRRERAASDGEEPEATEAEREGPERAEPERGEQERGEQERAPQE